MATTIAAWNADSHSERRGGVLMGAIDDSVALWSAPECERRGRPLVILLHGAGGHEGDMGSLFELLPPSHVAVSLRATRRCGDGQSWLGAINTDADLANELDAAATDLLNWIAAHQADSSHLGIIGWSQGGAVALQVLRLSPVTPAFVVTLAGFTGGSVRAADAELTRLRPPVFWGHGDADDVIPPQDTARLSSFLRAHTTLTEGEYRGVGHEISSAERRDVRAFVAANDEQSR